MDGRQANPSRLSSRHRRQPESRQSLLRLRSPASGPDAGRCHRRTGRELDGRGDSGCRPDPLRPGPLRATVRPAKEERGMTLGVGGSTMDWQLAGLSPRPGRPPAITVAEYEARLERARVLTAALGADALLVG